MKTIRTLLILIFMIVLIIISVSADSNNATGSAAVPTGNMTTVTLKPTSTPQTTSILTPLKTTPTQVPANTTVVQTTANGSALNTSANATTTTQIPAEPSDDQPRTGNITAVSSPLGANILIDGVFYGYTPGKIAGISTGNHIVRLTMSGYYDYEGNIYVIPGQITSVYGTLQPINNYPPPQDATTAPITAAVQSTPVTPAGPLDNPTVLAAIIGTFSAVIGAIVAILTHFSKIKKE
jgi:hypothetical protein